MMILLVLAFLCLALDSVSVCLHLNRMQPVCGQKISINIESPQ